MSRLLKNASARSARKLPTLALYFPGPNLADECFQTEGLAEAEAAFKELSQRKNSLKAMFLAMSKVDRRARLAGDAAMQTNDELATEIDEKVDASRRQKAESRESGEQAKSEMKAAASFVDKLFAESRLKLEDYRGGLAESSVQWFF